MQVVIMRGIAGSGKSTYVKNTFGDNINVKVCSADHFHTVNGVYKFDPKRAGAAHNACLASFLSCVSRNDDGYDYVIVDNTNTTAWEIAPYYRLAEIKGCDVKIVEVQVPVEVAIRRNVHHVPATTIKAMHSKMMQERLPPWWKVEVVVSPAE